MTSRSWDAGTYDRVSDVQEGWAHAVLDRLALRGGEVVLDAGCGSGRVTRLLLDRLPRGRVVAVDASAEMTARAREALPADRVTVLTADLAALELPEPVDAIFSNAVFHWIPDHARLFGALRRVLRPGGPLVAQCGAAGNLAGFLSVADAVGARAPFAEHLEGFERPVRFADARGTEERLRDAGFREVRVWVEPSDVTPADPAAFVATVNLRCHLERLPAKLREPYVDEVLRRCGEPLVLDYQRLNIDAR